MTDGGNYELTSLTKQRSVVTLLEKMKLVSAAISALNSCNDPAL